MNGVRPLVLAVCVIVLAACTGPLRQHRPSVPSRYSGAQTSATATRGTRVGRLGRPECRPASPINRAAGFPEVEGTGDHLKMWGLIMAAHPHQPLRVNEDVKIVWRITGAGGLRLTTIDPHGRTHSLQWGPVPHLQGSSYTRPGDEWGAGYRFTQPGCWTLLAQRGSALARVWLTVAD